MKNFIIKLSQNPKMVAIAKRIFLYFPSLKYILIEYAYSSSSSKKNSNIKNYSSDFLQSIKEEIEEKKNQRDAR